VNFHLLISMLLLFGDFAVMYCEGDKGNNHIPVD